MAAIFPIVKVSMWALRMGVVEVFGDAAVEVPLPIPAIRATLVAWGRAWVVLTAFGETDIASLMAVPWKLASGTLLAGDRNSEERGKSDGQQFHR